ncbi:antichymotrypsin-2-like isoform X4 [Belonocnema kinseyi]|uniref:antichymotrypsin-2-like isoform X4 n=1 Tax=Belonocnema kinseyi TaxID=2817044 RepID=UPI00143D55F3|nr:antichymotrypsin-2-like isoform X4 [Belonocnema kinseyi]
MRSFLLLSVLLACSMAEEIETKLSPLQAVSKSVESFSTNFYKTVSKNEKGNLITSPLSAGVVLSMAAYGARENTEKQMRDVLKLPADDTLGRSGFQNLIDNLNSVKDVELRLANKIFPKKGLEIKPEFKALTADSFRSAEEQLDFAQSAESASIINAWCQNKTNNKIKDLIKPDDLNSDTAMVLVNAVYFKGQWKKKFDAKNTEERPFHIDHKTVKNVSTMYQSVNIIYGVLPDLKAKFVEIPYKGEEVSMIIVLPDEVNGLAELEQKLENLDINTLRQKGYPHDVELYLPKFKIESTIELNNVLTEMGMEEMFSDKANFSGIADVPLKVSKVLQKAFIEVNEEGAEAAAATGLSGRRFLVELDRLVFDVNKPFLFFLITTFKTSVIFQGHLQDPAKYQTLVTFDRE